MDFVPELVSAELVKSVMTLPDHVCRKTEMGQYWAMFDSSGVDKTSLVRVAFGRLSLNRGNATLDSQGFKGIDPTELTTRVALVSKSSAPSIRGGQRILDLVCTATWGINVHRGEEYEAEDEARCQDLLEVFGISHLVQREPCTLSEGGAQQVLLVCSSISDPKVLIFDEPGVGFGLGVQELLLSALGETMSGMHAPRVVLVIHQVEDTPAGIIHTAIMVEGRTIVQGPVNETLIGIDPSHAYGLLLSAGCDADRWWACGLK